MPRKQFNFRLPSEIVEAARSVATLRGITLTKLIEDTVTREVIQSDLPEEDAAAAFEGAYRRFVASFPGRSAEAR